MKKCLLAALLGALSTTPAQALDYDHLFVFGDSLSDAGAYVGRPDAGAGQRFTTDPGPVWVETLGAGFGVPVVANNPTNPNTSPNGNDYAQGGARVEDTHGIGQTPSPLSAQPITTQIQTYLSAHPRAPGNALYIVWGGANDVFAQAAAAAGGLPQDQVGANIQAAAGRLNEQIQLLAATGARTLIVPTLPDIGQTPATILTAIQTVGAGNPNLATALGAATLALRAPGTTLAEQQATKASAMATAAGLLGVPVEVLRGAAAQVGGGFTQLSDGFNRALQFELSRGTANVVTLDMTSFITEAIADPASFGFTNVTGQACNTPSSLPCTTAELAAPGAEHAFLFADSVHPTTGGQDAIAAYARSVLEAPGLISTLPQAAYSMGRGFLQGLQTQIDLTDDAPIGAWSPFAVAGYQSSDLEDGSVGAWDADSDSETIGGAYRMDANWTYGLALSRLASDTSWGDRGGFDYRGVYGTVFAHYRDPRYFADLIGSFGNGNYDNIRRHVGFGVDPSGDTDGTHFLIAANAGLTLWNDGEGLAVGPLFGLVYQNVSVNGYDEDRATGLRYSDQSIEMLNGELGLFVDYQASARLKIRGALVREQSLADDSSDLNARPVTLSSNGFTLPGVPADDGLWRIGLSAGFAISKSVSATLDYSYRDGDSLGATHVFNLGLRVSL